MQQQIIDAIESFDHAFERFNSTEIQVTNLFKHSYLLSPLNAKKNKEHAAKKYPLTIMAVTHGNEVAGIKVLTQIAGLIESGLVHLPFNIVLQLGNFEASLANKRFIDRDLNRSFGREESNTIEDRRARELETVLRETGYLLDIHQTIEPTKSPFLIFRR